MGNDLDGRSRIEGAENIRVFSSWGTSRFSNHISMLDDGSTVYIGSILTLTHKVTGSDVIPK